MKKKTLYRNGCQITKKATYHHFERKPIFIAKNRKEEDLLGHKHRLCEKLKLFMEIGFFFEKSNG